MELLRQHGYGEGILRKIATELEVTSLPSYAFHRLVLSEIEEILTAEKNSKIIISNNSITFSFGKNLKPLPQVPPLIESIKEALDDRILLSLAIAAFFTIITNMVATGPAWGWVQGVSIYFAIFIIVSLSALNDWVKDKQFVRLQSLVKDENIAVIRGKYGATQAVNIYDLVVGDIVILETGCRVPADCLLLEGLDVTVDESVYYAGENKTSKKLAASGDNFDQRPDPFLLSNSLVATGAGKAVVLCVGERSRRGLKEAKLDTESKTPLQEKLQNLAGQFTKWGLIGAGAVFVALLVNFVIRTSAIAEYQTAGHILLGISNMFTFAIAIIIVAVPEGLPLVITISLAYSVMRMKNDGLLVRNLDSPEMMGKVDEIITGKTGTLTKSEMKVDQFYA